MVKGAENCDSKRKEGLEEQCRDEEDALCRTVTPAKA